MQTPPFRLAGPALHDPANASCCAGVDAPGTAAGSRRARLAELDANFHCSVIGTCLATGELRKLVPRHVPDVDRQTASDLELHHEAVQLAHDAGPGAKALHKALDDRHAATVQRFAKIKTAGELEQVWRQALASGEVPGAYWAVMTHAHTTVALRKQAFGDVHMLSHLVGAANRADIRRLQALERDNTALTDRLERHQLRLQQVTEERQALADRLAELEVLQHRSAGSPDAEPELAALRGERDAREQALAYHTSRREIAESQLQVERQVSADLQAHLNKTLALLRVQQQELHAVEGTLAERFAPQDGAAAETRQLQGRRVVYVGGRPSSNQTIRALVQAAGGELVLHDGGVEDRKGLLVAALHRADFVVFPVDCVDHDSMGTIKRVCERNCVPFYPVRSASVASFTALVAELSTGTAARTSPVSRFCLKHG